MNNFQPVINFIRDLYRKPAGLIPLHAPVFNGNEKKYLEECIDTTYVSSVGNFVDQFELAIAKYTGAKNAVACINGTSALHLALKLAGVENGDEVITQPLTFVATANAITYCNANPVFLDVDEDTMGLSPAKLESWLDQNVILKSLEHWKEVKPYNKFSGNKISACIPMHTFGYPCRIDEIVDICSRFNIPVIEDAAESLGSYYKGKHTGTFGKIGILSFNGNKILTTGGGGMLLFQDEKFAKKAKHLTTQAKEPHPWEFFHDQTGYNYRMPNINAALGLAQLEQLPEFLKSKKLIAVAYKEFFLSMYYNEIVFINEPEDSDSNHWLNCISFKDKKTRDGFLKFTNENEIMTRPTWQLMNKLAMFKDCQTDELLNAQNCSNKLVNLPSSVISDITSKIKS